MGVFQQTALEAPILISLFDVNWHKSIATKLSWVSISMVVMTVLTVGIGLIWIANQAQRDITFRLQEKNADQVALLISSYVNNAVDKLRLFDDVETLGALPLSKQKNILENMLTQSRSLFSQFAILDQDGVEKIRVSRFHTFLPHELKKRAADAAFLTAIKGQTYISPVHISPDSGLLSLQVAIPVKTVKTVDVLIAEVNATQLWQEVSQIKIGKSGYAYLVDGNGRFIAYQDISEVLKQYGSDMSKMPPVADFINGISEDMRQIHEYVGLVHEPVIGLNAPVKGIKWAVIVELPTREAYASVTRMKWFLLVLLLLGVATAGGVGFIISNRVVHPIRALTESVERMSGADLSAEVAWIHHQDEVGVLARAFSRMQQAIKLNFERSAALLKLNQMTGANLQEIMIFGFEEAVRLTKSKNGYLGLMNEEETVMTVQVWSRSVMSECNIADSTLDFPLDHAGMWAEVVRQRRPIITNDYHAPNLLKKGYPEGHVNISRHMNVPVFDGQRIVLVAGVGNKEEAYDETDVQQLTVLMEGLWRLIERNRSEQELRESQRRLADIIEFLPDATMVIDRKGNVIAWNKAIEDMTGVMAERMLGKGNYEYAIPFYGERRPMLIDLVLQPKEEIQKEYRSIKRQGNVLVGEAYISDLRGSSVYQLGTASPLRNTNGVIVGAIETIRDITDQRQVEAALASEHDRLAAILDGIPLPAFMIDRNQVVVLWNRNNEIFTGKTKEEMLEKKLDLNFLFKGKTQPTLAELVLKMTDEELIRKFASRGIRKNEIFPEAFESVGVILIRGEERIVSIQAARIYNAKGKVIGAVQTAQDITESIRIQKEREKLQAQLIQAQKLESIGTLAGGIAHDFNNILTGIMGYTELYKSSVTDRPKVYHGMEQVLIAANRAKGLVQQILTFSRKAEQEKKPIALAPIVKEVVKFMRASLPTTIEIRQNIEETSDVIMADATQMHQVLVNLCTNAGYAMKETGGVLEIGMEEVFINENDRLQRPPMKNGLYLAVTVRDTGQGVPQENLGRTFEPYFTTKEKGEGTGLGLAVVHGIVKDHGGEIRVYSEVGKGTIFRIFLPLMEKHVADVRDREEPLLAGKGETILFIDDEKMVVDLSKELLEGLGYRVVAETDPVKAIVIFKESSDTFDLVITDKTMPHLTGFDVAWEIRHIRKDIPIVLCSGFQEKEDLKKLNALGIGRLITKPIRMSDLAKAIRDELEKNKPKLHVLPRI
ncbi:MAG: Sensor histidine kinase RcsC [Syntrophus sp. SKADARSKE-3]|nr:Sensor histidine kinase RcsC [Syntrophus sp. SKADARSKE-3]